MFNKIYFYYKIANYLNKLTIDGLKNFAQAINENFYVLENYLLKIWKMKREVKIQLKKKLVTIIAFSLKQIYYICYFLNFNGQKCLIGVITQKKTKTYEVLQYIKIL